jgi:Tol biopolymer transport system component
VVLLWIGAALASSAGAAAVELISKAAPGMIAETPDEQSLVEHPGVISDDGRYVAFESWATTLLSGVTDTNNAADVYLYDRMARTLTLISRSAKQPEATGNDDSRSPMLSGDGRFVVFRSGASDLVPGQIDTNGAQDVFLYDRVKDSIRLVSHTSASTVTAANGGSFWDPAISRDGRFVAFASEAGDLVAGQTGPAGSGVFVFDVATGSIAIVSHANGSPLTVAAGYSIEPLLSADGRWIVYLSNSSELVSNQTGGGFQHQVILYDRMTGANALVTHIAGSINTASNGDVAYPRISDDGRWILYRSSGTDLVPGLVTNASPQIFLYRRTTGTNVLVSHSAASAVTAADGFSESPPAISGNGDWIAFDSSGTDLVSGQSDTNADLDVFLYQRATGAVTLASHIPGSPVTAGNGAALYGSLDADGSRFAFISLAGDLVAGVSDTNRNFDVFLFERSVGTVSLVSRKRAEPATGNSVSTLPVLSADGDWIVFDSGASDLQSAVTDTNGYVDVYLNEIAGGTQTVVSVRSGEPSLTAGGESFVSAQTPAVSADGRWVAFYSNAVNLVPGQKDGNNDFDVFLHDRLTGRTTLVSHAAGSANRAGNGVSWRAMVSDDGRWVAFQSAATDLVYGQSDTNDGFDVFLFDRFTGRTTLLSHAAGAPATTGNAACGWPVLSRSGSRVAFPCLATNLVGGVTDANGQDDVFVYERSSGALSLVSHAAGSARTTADGASWPLAISADGAWLGLKSAAPNLVNGQVDTNGGWDLFLYSLANGTVRLLSRAAGTVATAGDEPAQNGQGLALSGDGRWVAFSSDATNLVDGQSDVPETTDLFLFDRDSGRLELISHPAGHPTQAAGSLYDPGISLDGRWIAFTSSAADLVPGQVDTEETWDVFLHDRMTGTVRLVSHQPGAPDLSAAPGYAAFSSLSLDGSLVTFWATVPLMAGQTPSPPLGLYVYDRRSGSNVLISPSLASPLQAANGDIGDSLISGDGCVIAFSHWGSDLVAGDHNGKWDVFAYRNEARKSCDSPKGWLFER